MVWSIWLLDTFSKLNKNIKDGISEYRLPQPQNHVQKYNVILIERRVRFGVSSM